MLINDKLQFVNAQLLDTEMSIMKAKVEGCMTVLLNC